MWSLLTGSITKWLVGGAVGLMLIGGAITWHKLNFVSRAEVKQWQEYAETLSKAVEERDRKLDRYNEAMEQDEAKIEALEKEREKLLEEDRRGDDPVILDRDDVERLRNFR